MGWSRGLNYRGEEVGYGLEAVCEEPGCTAEIDKGLGYACGNLDAVTGEVDAPGCAHYFCSEHLYYMGGPPGTVFLCERCCDALEEGGADEE